MNLRIRLWSAGVALCAAAATCCLVALALSEVEGARLDDIATSFESVRLAQEIALRMAINYRSLDPAVRASSQAELQSLLSEYPPTIQGKSERRQFDLANQAIERYLATPRTGPSGMLAETMAFTAAFGEIWKLLQINEVHAHDARDRAHHTRTIGHIVGLLSLLLVLVVAVAGIFWLRGSAFRPLLDLEQALTRVAAGDMAAQVPVRGPPEFREMAATCNQMVDSLARARVRQLNYVASAVHDLRNPIAAIQLAIGYLAPDRPLPGEERIRSLLMIVVRQLKRLNAIVGEILNVARIQAGDLALKYERIDLAELVRESGRLYTDLAPGHQIEVKAPIEGLTFEGDRVLVEQIVNNLVSNAVKFSPRGSRVLLTAFGDLESVEIQVSDRGEGISATDRERIFEPYFRVSGPSARPEGSGLGLFSVRRIVEAHGGHISLDSRIGQGSTFSVVLPRHPVARPLEPSRPAASSPDASP
jgi:signal transduction histidine kinase